MSDAALEKFGTFLIRRVRDESIEVWRMKITGQMKDKASQTLYQEVAKMPDECQRILERAGGLVTDLVLHNLLWALAQSEDIDISVRLDDGELIPDLSTESDGFPGELCTEDGWISRFSNEAHEES